MDAIFLPLLPHIVAAGLVGSPMPTNQVVEYKAAQTATFVDCDLEPVQRLGDELSRTR